MGFYFSAFFSLVDAKYCNITQEIQHVLTTVCLHINCYVHTACDVNFVVKVEGLQKVTGSHIHNKKAMLREHKPPLIQSIWISDFGLPDPKRDPDRHQNCITWSLSHALWSLQKISSKSVHKFASNPTDRQTNRQTDQTKNMASFFSGGNKTENISETVPNTDAVTTGH